MAHELEEVDGRWSHLGRQDAWHHLTDVVDENITTELIMERAPWVLSPVEMRDTYVNMGLIGYSKTPRTGATVRTYDNKIVGEGLSRSLYGIVQPMEVWEFIQAIVKDTIPCISAGTIREGRQGFFTFAREEQEIAGIPMTPTISAAYSHDSSLKVQVLFGKTIICCANTMSWAIEEAVNRIMFRHTMNVAERMTDAAKALGAFEEYDLQVNHMIESLTSMKIREFKPLLDGVLPYIDTPGRSQTMRNEARATVMEYLDSIYTEGHKNTAWAFIQAVNTYEGWAKPTRASKGVQQGDRIAIRQFDAIVKQHTPLTNKALDLVLA